MTDEFTIRLMRPGEEYDVCALIARVFDQHVAPDFSPAGIEEFYRYANPEAMAQRIRADSQVLVAADERRLMGMVEIRGSDHIAMLFVEARGQGIGRRLVEEALRLCAAREPRPERVTVHASRYAVPIYHHLGFEADGAERTENGITYLPMVFPCGRLSRDTDPPPAP